RLAILLENKILLCFYKKNHYFTIRYFPQREGRILFKKLKTTSKLFIILIDCSFFISIFVFYDLVKKENYVIKDMDNIENGIYHTLKNNKILNPTARNILVEVDEYTRIIDNHGNKSVIEKGMKVLIEYNTVAFSNPPVTKATKIITLSLNYLLFLIICPSPYILL